MFKIFVGNLSAKTDTEALKDLFSRHALVDDLAWPVDPQTGKRRSFAIVMIKDEQQGRAALVALRGTRLDGRPLIINQARKKKKGAEAPARELHRRSRTFRRRGPASDRGEGSAGGMGGGHPGRPRTFPPRSRDDRRDQGERRPGGPMRP